MLAKNDLPKRKHPYRACDFAFFQWNHILPLYHHEPQRFELFHPPIESTLLCAFERLFGFIHRYLYDKIGYKFAISLETIDSKTMEWSVFDMHGVFIVVIEF